MLNDGLDVDVSTGEVSVEKDNLTHAQKAEMAQKLSEYFKMKKDEGAIDV